MTVEELRNIIPNAYDALRRALLRQNPDAYNAGQAGILANLEIAMTFDNQPDAMLIDTIALNESVFIALDESAFVSLSLE